MAKPSDITFGDTQLASPSAQNLELTSLSEGSPKASLAVGRQPGVGAEPLRPKAQEEAPTADALFLREKSFEWLYNRPAKDVRMGHEHGHMWWSQPSAATNIVFLAADAVARD